MLKSIKGINTNYQLLIPLINMAYQMISLIVAILNSVLFPLQNWSNKADNKMFVSFVAGGLCHAATISPGFTAMSVSFFPLWPLAVVSLYWNWHVLQSCIRSNAYREFPFWWFQCLNWACVCWHHITINRLSSKWMHLIIPVKRCLGF